MPNILIVDDEPLVVSLLQRLLGDEGYSTFPCVGGTEALALLGKNPCPIDVVLTDVKMPNVDGLRVAQSVRARWPHAQVVFMSGYCGSADSATAFADADHFLQKPFTRAALLNVLPHPVRRHTQPMSRSAHAEGHQAGYDRCRSIAVALDSPS